MNKKYILVLLIISIGLLVMPKSYANKELDGVELRENNDINKKTFAMYVENSLGQYEPYTEDSNYFPNSLKYHYNESMSKCVDNNDQEVDEILTHNEDNSVTVTSNRTVYCYLYFDLDKDKPITPNVSLSNLSSIDNNYTNTKLQTVTIIYNDEDIESYCVSLNSDTCTNYETTGLDTANKKITLSNYDLGEDGNKTIKVRLKDLAGNISENPGSITKILDTQPPVINNLTVSGATTYSNVNYVTTASPSVTLTWSNDDVARYCMSNADCTPETNISAKTVTINVPLTNNAANTIHAKIIDKAGNVSNDKTYGLTVDTAKPGTPTVSMSNVYNTYVTNQTPTITATYSDSDIVSYCISLGSTSCTSYVTTGLDTSKKTITVSNYQLGVAGSKIVRVWLKDRAGNVSSTPGSITKTLDVTAPTLTLNTPTINETSIVVPFTAIDTNGIASITCSGATCSCTGTTSGSCTFSSLTAGTRYNNTLKIVAKDNANLSTSKSGDWTTKDLSLKYTSKTPIQCNGGYYDSDDEWHDTWNIQWCVQVSNYTGGLSASGSKGYFKCSGNVCCGYESQSVKQHNRDQAVCFSSSFTIKDSAGKSVVANYGSELCTNTISMWENPQHLDSDCTLASQQGFYYRWAE